MINAIVLTNYEHIFVKCYYIFFGAECTKYDDLILIVLFLSRILVNIGFQFTTRFINITKMATHKLVCL